MAEVSGTEGYAAAAEALAAQYESIGFDDVHGGWRHLLPAPPARVVDIGAGTGRDAAALAALGHAVLAVEPTAAFRRIGTKLHPGLTWLDDSLPALTRLAGRFDLVLLSAVWMHLDRAERRLAMPRLAGLLLPGGRLLLSLRHGPVPAGRRMFAVGADETLALAIAAGLRPVFHQDQQPSQFGQPGVSWTRLGLAAEA